MELLPHLAQQNAPHFLSHPVSRLRVLPQLGQEAWAGDKGEGRMWGPFSSCTVKLASRNTPVSAWPFAVVVRGRRVARGTKGGKEGRAGTPRESTAAPLCLRADTVWAPRFLLSCSPRLPPAALPGSQGRRCIGSRPTVLPAPHSFAPRAGRSLGRPGHVR